MSGECAAAHSRAMTISRTITRLAAATAGVGVVITLAAGTAGADVGAPAPTEPRAGAKISLTNAVITGVVEGTAVLRPTNSYDGLTTVLAAAQSLSISNTGGGTL